MRLGFVPMKQIAEQLDCTVGEAESAWIRMLGAVPPDMRARVTREELERIDQLERVYWVKAIQGDYRAAELCMKFKERRARMLGLDAPPQTESALMPERVRISSTERISASLDRIAGKVTIEGTAIHEDAPAPPPEGDGG